RVMGLQVRKMAERVGFEPTLPFRVNTLSKRAPSATRPSLRRRFQEALRTASLLKQRKRGACTPRGVVCAFMGRRIELQGAISIAELWTGFVSRNGHTLVFPRASCSRRLLVFFVPVQVLGEIILVAHFFDGMHLAFEPVDVMLFIDENFFEELTGAVVAGVDA